jgi:hypothetical protein
VPEPPDFGTKLSSGASDKRHRAETIGTPGFQPRSEPVGPRPLIAGKNPLGVTMDSDRDSWELAMWRGWGRREKVNG